MKAAATTILGKLFNIGIGAYKNATGDFSAFAANTGGVLISDGVNVSANSTVAGNTTVTLLTVDGGQAVSGTYNAS